MDTKGPAISFDSTNLYREESFTDLRVGSIRRLTPVTPTGEPDPNRTPRFVASAHVMTPMGALPIESPIDAATLAEAMEVFPQAVEAGVERLLTEAREMQRQQAGRIIVPDAARAAAATGAMPPGVPGGPGGGLVKLR